MRRALLLAGMAVWLFSCADRGNEQGQENTPSPMQSDPRDTVNRGVGAGADEHTNTGAGTGTGTGTGAAGAGGSASGVNAGTGGAGTSGNDTTNRGQQQ